MLKRSQAGFTLIEVMLVLSLTGLLLLIALGGQAQLRDHARFDGGMEKLVASINDARNQATSGVNTVGGGTGSVTCGGSGQYVFAGVSWTANNAIPNGPVQLEYYEAGPIDPDTHLLKSGASACKYDTEMVDLGLNTMQVASALVGSSSGGRVLFIRTNDGKLRECPANLSNPSSYFALTSICASGKQVIGLKDTKGNTGQVSVDGSGLGKRDN